jgi:autotransporter-associated beta strand protein
MFASTAQNLTINAIGAGDLNMVAGLQGVLGSGSASVTINAPIVGAGEIQPSNGGNIFFNGTNTYTGGTNLVSTATLVHFNNPSSFGTNFINMGVAGFAPLLGSGGATITLPNAFTTSINNGGINFAADANTPVVSTGTWTLGANNLQLRNNGVASSPLTLSGAISGSANIALSANNSGTIVFSGPNMYTGTTTVGKGTTAVTLKLGAANTIASSSSVIMAGGNLDPAGLNHTMSATTLGLTDNSVIDYIAGASEVDFANSSALAWTAGKILNLANWDFTTTKLRFGTDATGLTTGQLAQIEFNGGGLGSAQLDANGYVVVPEPASIALMVGGVAIAALRRRRSR